MSNLFALEPLLIERLTAVLPPEVAVLTAPYLADLGDLEGRTRHLPAVFLMHLDGTPVEAPAGASYGLRLAQRWAVVLAVLERSAQPQGAVARWQTGELGWTVVGALHGWRPIERGRVVQLARVLSTLYRPGGLQLLPLIFHHETPRLCG